MTRKFYAIDEPITLLLLAWNTKQFREVGDTEAYLNTLHTMKRFESFTMLIELIGLAEAYVKGGFEGVRELIIDRIAEYGKGPNDPFTLWMNGFLQMTEGQEVSKWLEMLEIAAARVAYRESGGYEGFIKRVNTIEKIMEAFERGGRSLLGKCDGKIQHETEGEEYDHE
ncbi:hypothetical protein [Hydrogenimonas urashimensis]|uniref:hypothetical protein n=1 Tax=Hydrogenimonas urashimensis TaxID=2740515 RepID=UPI001914E5F1|nr:hypothetical protein [Hydrogenimonas urashimensis]